VSIRPTRTPAKRETTGAKAAARIRRPTAVRVNSRASSTISASTDPYTKMS
jgi:hypothetical protein